MNVPAPNAIVARRVRKNAFKNKGLGKNGKVLFQPRNRQFATALDAQERAAFAQKLLDAAHIRFFHVGARLAGNSRLSAPLGNRLR